MSVTIALPSGANAVLRDAKDVTERQRRPIRKIQTQLAADAKFVDAVQAADKANKAGGELDEATQRALAEGMGEAFDPLETLNDLLVLAAVESWSYSFAPSLDSLLDVPARDLDALRKAASPFMAELSPDFEPTPDAASPIAPSGV
jgi:hypothetical protein